MSVNFFNSDEPNFLFNNKNAVTDFECIIESELPEILPQKRYETYKIEGRNGELNETLNDYEAFDYEIKSITIPYDRLREVKKWLNGPGKLIKHNQEDQYYECIANMSKEVQFENEWGYFYTFDVTFRCQPFKKKVNEKPRNLKVGEQTVFDFGDETAYPKFKIKSAGGDIGIYVNGDEFIVLNTLEDDLFIDCELGIVNQPNNIPFSKGVFPTLEPGNNTIIVIGSIYEVQMWNRSVYL